MAIVVSNQAARQAVSDMRLLLWRMTGCYHDYVNRATKSGALK
jgi:hypothetical protein